MGSIKNSSESGLTYPLTDEEFNYVMNVSQARDEIVQQYNRVMSSYLHYVACSRLGYDSTDSLQFELDLSSEEHKLIVTKLSEE